MAQESNVKVGPAWVDSRDISEVRPSNLAGFARVHLFAGIGGWEYALQLAGWPSGRPVWTGSCPCQPFSVAGKGEGAKSNLHLWPHFIRLIAECRPPVVFGEQVASKAGLAWLDLVSSDLEREGYAVGAADLCAASVGAPHIRQRLFWVAQSGLGDTDSERRQREQLCILERKPIEDLPETSRAGEGGSCWSKADWVLCRDPGGPRWRPVEPGSFPLANGIPARVGRLRAYGNSIVPQLAAEFIRAFLDAERDL